MGWPSPSKALGSRGHWLEIDVIAAVVLGRTSMFCDAGGIPGTVRGAILVQVQKNGTVPTEVKPDATIGAVLALSILVTN